MQLASLPPMILHNFHHQMSKENIPEVPLSFSSLEEAHDYFQYYANRYLHLWNDSERRARTQSLSEAQIYLDTFRQWRLSLQSFLQSYRDTMSPSAQQGARLLQMNSQMLILGINVFLQDHRPRPPTPEKAALQYQLLGPLADDKSTAELKQILVFARSIVQQSLTLDGQHSLRDFSLDTNIVATLFGIVRLCCDPVVRRGAVDLLHVSPRQEGLWDGVVVAQVCEKLIEIEEHGLGLVKSCEDVPDWARVKQLRLGFDGDGRPCKVIYRRSNGPGDQYGSDNEKFFWIGEFSERFGRGTYPVGA